MIIVSPSEHAQASAYGGRGVRYRRRVLKSSKKLIEGRAQRRA